jgi:hypothetical protein
MRIRPVLLSLLAAILAGVALVQRREAPDPYSVDTLVRLLRRPLDQLPCTDGEATPCWRSLLEPPFAQRHSAGVTLRLGRLLADPTTARASALSAGELLALEAEGPEGPLGVPLWRAVLDGAAFDPDAPRTLKIHGCRHSADADAGPVIEDSYHARLSLARALRAHAKARAEGEPVTVLGEDTPLRGGVNFEIQLVGTTQAVQVSFDSKAVPALRARRPFARAAPSDERARASLVAALHALALEVEGFGPLTIEGESASAPGGVDLRLEVFGDRLALTARSGTSRLATHLSLSDSAAVSQ